jgi:hypothetical protein
MSRFFRKLIAVLMMMWLPLFSGATLAASLSMQMPSGACHEVMAEQAISNADMGSHHQHHGASPTSQDEQGSSCNTCGVCHLACTGFLTIQSVAFVSVQNAGVLLSPYLVSFSSISFAPLLPPPLARA